MVSLVFVAQWRPGLPGAAQTAGTPAPGARAADVAAARAQAKSKHVKAQLMIGIHCLRPSSCDSKVGRHNSSVRKREKSTWRRSRRTNVRPRRLVVRNSSEPRPGALLAPAAKPRPHAGLGARLRCGARPPENSRTGYLSAGARATRAGRSRF